MKWFLSWNIKLVRICLKDHNYWPIVIFFHVDKNEIRIYKRTKAKNYSSYRTSITLWSISLQEMTRSEIINLPMWILASLDFPKLFPLRHLDHLKRVPPSKMVMLKLGQDVWCTMRAALFSTSFWMISSIQSNLCVWCWIGPCFSNQKRKYIFYFSY